MLHSYHSYVLLWLQGLGMVILGPTLLDLSKQMNVDMAELSRGPAASSAGTLALALVGGLLCDR